jgi:acyl transferase domain-containing protein
VNNTPTLQEQREAHDRRARIIDQLQEQAVATANDLEARRRAINTAIAKTVRRQRIRAFLFVAAVVAWGLVCTAALAGMIALAI